MRRPSPALVIAILALAGAWGGPAVARALIQGRDIATNTITGRNVTGLSGRDIIPNGLDGSDIDEGTLDEVPAAGKARRARRVQGVRFKRFAYADPSGAATIFLAEAGLRITGFCNAGDLEATVVPTVPGGLLRIAVTTPSGTDVQSDNDFAPGDEAVLLPDGLNDASGTLSWYAPGGDTLTIQYLAQDGLDASTGHQCVIAGTAVHASK